MQRAQPFGVALHVIAEPGGGAPTLYLPSLLNKFFPTAQSAAAGNAPTQTTSEGLAASTLAQSLMSSCRRDIRH